MAVGPTSAAAEFVPESGIYYNPSQFGTGYVLEIQGDTFTFSIFSYDNARRAEFFISSGSLSGGLTAPLYRVAGGKPLGSTSQDESGAALSTTPIGSITLRSNFETADTFYGSLTLDLTLTSPPAEESPVNTFVITRMNFGYGGIGSTGKDFCWPDLSGSWVFVDKSNSSTALRYEFTEVVHQPQTVRCSSNSDASIVQFRDPVHGATLRCQRSFQIPDAPDGLIKFPGCELRQDGATQPLLSFDITDVGAKQMLGSSGRLSVIGSGEARRRQGNILGIRVE